MCEENASTPCRGHRREEQEEGRDRLDVPGRKRPEGAGLEELGVVLRRRLCCDEKAVDQIEKVYCGGQ